VNGTDAVARSSPMDAAPGLGFVLLTLVILVAVPSARPERLIADRWRYWLMVGAISVLLWAVIGYLVIHFVGARRPLRTLSTIAGMALLPVAIAPLLGWLNAAFDHTPAASAQLSVSGYVHHGRTGLIGVIFESTGHVLPDIRAEKLGPFFPQPTPPERTAFIAEYHPGALGIRWISALAPTGPYEERKR